MAVEQRRKCGFRKVGGIYLVAPALGHDCDRLPWDLITCPLCNAGYKPTRSWAVIENMAMFFGFNHDPCVDEYTDCMVCRPQPVRALLMWLGGRQYTPDDFVAEAMEQGVSRKVPRVPKALVVGETPVMMASRPIKTRGEPDEITQPGRIFCTFVPQRVEIILTESMAKDEGLMYRVEKRGLTPIFVPDLDPDHNPDAKNATQIKLEVFGVKQTR